MKNILTQESIATAVGVLVFGAGLFYAPLGAILIATMAIGAGLVIVGWLALELYCAIMERPERRM